MSKKKPDKASKGQAQQEISIFSQDLSEEGENTNASSSKSKKDNLKSFNLQIMNLSEDLKNKPLQNPDDSLFTKIKNKFNKLNYKEDELIKDLNALLEKQVQKHYLQELFQVKACVSGNMPHLREKAHIKTQKFFS